MVRRWTVQHTNGFMIYWPNDSADQNVQESNIGSMTSLYEPRKSWLGWFARRPSDRPTIQETKFTQKSTCTVDQEK